MARVLELQISCFSRNICTSTLSYGEWLNVDRCFIGQRIKINKTLCLLIIITSGLYLFLLFRVAKGTYMARILELQFLLFRALNSSLRMTSISVITINRTLAKNQNIILSIVFFKNITIQGFLILVAICLFRLWGNCNRKMKWWTYYQRDIHTV